MPFANSIVGGVTLVRPAIRSPNYVPGVSGWSINRAGDAEFNDLTVRGVFEGNDYIINDSGIFLYNGTPALGNLVVSIASNLGTDQFGNDYLEGIVNYSGDEFVGIDVGNTYYGLLSAGGYSGAGLIGIVGTGKSVFYQSPFYTGSTDISTFTLNSGSSAQPWSSATYPHMHVGDSGFGMLWVDNAIVKSVPNAGTAEVWHTVGAAGNAAYNTGWATATMFNGAGNGPFKPLRYRKDAEDNVWIEGLTITTTAASPTIFTLPSGYFNSANRALIPVNFNIGGTVSAGFAQVTEAGVVNVSPSLSGHTIGANTQVYINGKLPLGNIS